jgi:hypothetical protein
MELKNGVSTEEVNSEVPQKLNFKGNNLSPQDKLQFAKWVLRGIFYYLHC